MKSKYCPGCGSPMSGNKCSCGYVADEPFQSPTTCHHHDCNGEIYRRVLRKDGTWYGMCLKHTPECFIDWRDKMIDEYIETNSIPVSHSRSEHGDYLAIYKQFSDLNDKRRKEEKKKKLEQRKAAIKKKLGYENKILSETKELPDIFENLLV